MSKASGYQTRAKTWTQHQAGNSEGSSVSGTNASPIISPSALHPKRRKRSQRGTSRIPHDHRASLPHPASFSTTHENPVISTSAGPSGITAGFPLVASEEVLPLPERDDREVTPERHYPASDSLLVTPYGNHSSSYTSSLAHDQKHVVDEANRYLKGDLRSVKTLPVKEWALHCMDLDIDTDRCTLTENMTTKFNDYLRKVDTAPKETHLYHHLIELLNSLSNEDESKNNVMFYRQDPIHVRGSLVGQSPDIGAVFKELLKKRLRLKLNEKIYWGQLLALIEGKHEQGRMIFADFVASEERPEHVKKRPRDEDTVISPDEPASKTRRTVAGSSTSRASNPGSQTVQSTSKDPGSTAGCQAPRQHRLYSRQLPPPKRKTPLGVRMQLAGYARDILSHGIFRSHVIIFIVDSKLARGIFYDRSVIVESGLLKLTNKDDQLIFAKMIKQLRALPPEALGVVSNLHVPFMKNPNSLAYGHSMPQFAAADGPPSNDIFEHPEGSLFTFSYKDGFRTVRLKRVLFRSNGIIGRGTIVVRVECACRLCAPGCCDWKGKRLIMKLSFPGKDRVSEKVFMDRCDVLAKDEHAWVLNHLPHIYWSTDVLFSDQTPQSRLKGTLGDDYEMRIMRVSIQEELKPMSTLETAKECGQTFYDVVQCHHWAWKYPKILHRDISLGNIMIREKGGKKYGVLNDWDLAIWLNQIDGPTSKFRTGTKPFMAHEQQSSKWKGPHLYRHDLESVFYAMLLLSCLCTSPSEKDPYPETGDYRYEEWYEQDDEYLRGKKVDIIKGDDSWTPSVTTFFAGFALWLAELQYSLSIGFDELRSHRRANQATQLVPQARYQPLQRPDPQPFDENTLGDHFSYEAVVLIMHVFNNEFLETHGKEWQVTLVRLRANRQQSYKSKPQQFQS